MEKKILIIIDKFIIGMFICISIFFFIIDVLGILTLIGYLLNYKFFNFFRYNFIFYPIANYLCHSIILILIIICFMGLFKFIYFIGSEMYNDNLKNKNE